MAVEERDPSSGYLTTGHDWNGIKELNSPVPRIVFAFMVVTHLYALVAWFLLPTWPLGQTFTKGLLGIDQKTAVAADLASADAARADWTDTLAAAEFDTIRANPDLMARALATAEPLFGQNCQACHGAGGIGGPGFPRLKDDIWVWGGTADAIANTLRVGINSAHPATQIAVMPAFGNDGLLTRPEISVLVDYIQTLGNGVIAEDMSEGAVLYQTNCAGCHGEDARGIEGSGAQNLTDSDWLYGGDAASLRHTLIAGRQGKMPNWLSRLTEAEIRAMALYVEGLSGAAP